MCRVPPQPRTHNCNATVKQVDNHPTTQTPTTRPVSSQKLRETGVDSRHTTPYLWLWACVPLRPRPALLPPVLSSSPRRAAAAAPAPASCRPCRPSLRHRSCRHPLGQSWRRHPAARTRATVPPPPRRQLGTSVKSATASMSALVSLSRDIKEGHCNNHKLDGCCQSDCPPSRTTSFCVCSLQHKQPPVTIPSEPSCPALAYHRP